MKRPAPDCSVELAKLDSGRASPSLTLSAGASDLDFALASALLTVLRNLDPPFEQGKEGKEQPSPQKQGQVSPAPTPDYLSDRIPPLS